MSDSQQVISETLMIAGAGDASKTMIEAVKAAIPQLPAGLSDGILSVAQQVGMFRTIAQQQVETVASNTQALLLNTAAQRSGGGTSVASSIAGTAAKVLGGGVGLIPLVSSIVGLFRGNKQEAPPELLTYSAPASINFEGAAPPTAGLPIVAVDYGQDGLPRPIRGAAQPIPGGGPTEEAPVWLTSSMAFSENSQGLLSFDSGRDWSQKPATAGTPVYAPNVTVQVQAMDSRSFLDHSDQIAQAVREAILNAHALGSVVSEL